MPLSVNGAGLSAANPILRLLGVTLIASADSVDVDDVLAAGVDQSLGFPPANSVLASLSPAETVVTRGLNATYNDTSKQLTIATTTGLTAGDYLYLSHASIADGIYQIATVVNATAVTLVGNPFNGAGNQTGVAYQVAWRYDAVAGTAPLSSSVAGQLNVWKFRAATDLGNATDREDSFYVRDAPAGAGFIAIDGQAPGGAGNDPTPTLDILPAWPNRGGISHITLANHSTLARNDLRWGDGSVGEKTIAAAIAGGLSFTAGDGVKAGQFRFMTRSGSSIFRAEDISFTLDTTGPTITLHMTGR